MKNFDYLEPKTVAEACALLKQHGGEAKVFAGGAHLTILMKQGLLEPKSLVNIKKIAELKGIRYDEAEGLTIGALVTHRELETSALVKEQVSRAVRSGAGSRQHPRAQHGHGGRQSRFRRAVDGSIANLYRPRRQGENCRTQWAANDRG